MSNRSLSKLPPLYHPPGREEEEKSELSRIWVRKGEKKIRRRWVERAIESQGEERTFAKYFEQRKNKSKEATKSKKKEREKQKKPTNFDLDVSLRHVGLDRGRKKCCTRNTQQIPPCICLLNRCIFLL